MVRKNGNGSIKLIMLKPFLERTVLFSFFLFSLSCWVFIEIADEVREKSTYHIDDRILLALRNAENPEMLRGHKWFTNMAMDVTAAGSVTNLMIFICGVVGAFLLEKKYRAAMLILLASVTGQVMSSLLKYLFDRPRPDVVPHLTEVSTTSFPSGHSMMSAVVYLTVAAVGGQFIANKATRIYLLILAGILTILIGLSRIFLGVHYPSDVLAGWTAGLAWATLWLMISRWLQIRGQVEQANES